MWTTPALVLALGLAAAQDGKLGLTDVNFSHGPNGPVRADARYLPGDVLFLDFDITGLKFDAEGKASYGVGMLVTDAKGGTVLKQDPKTQQALNYLGGSLLPGVAHLQVGMEQPPGKYKIKITVNDDATKGSASAEREFEVLPAGFGLVQVGFSSDPDGTIPEAPLALVGESVFVNFSAVGFQRDKQTKQPKLSVQMRILDEKGQPTLAKALTGEANSGITESLKLVPMQFALTLNRPGKFTIELTAKDLLANKTATVTLPFTVVNLR